jgi:hypothetical protein
MVHLRFVTLCCAAWVFAASLPAPVTAAPAATPAADAGEPAIPTRVALVPFRCVRPCEELAYLQKTLTDRMVEKGIFELLVTPVMEDLLLKRPELRTGMDSLIARAIRGEQPDSATGAVLARRLNVEGFLYASMGGDGPRVAIWALAPRAGDVWQYRSGRPTRGFMPESKHQGAQTTAAQYTTGGVPPSSGGTPSGSSASSKSGGSDLTATMPDKYSKDPTLIDTSESPEVRMDLAAETIVENLEQIRHPGGVPAKDQ